MHIQALQKSGLMPVILVRFPKDHGVIVALSAGEVVQVRARTTSAAGDFPEWQASDWRDAKASDDANEILSSFEDDFLVSAQMPGPLVARGNVTAALCQTAGDDLDQQTLRDVLADILPRTSAPQMTGVAVTAAKAICAAFDELRATDAGKS